MSCEQIMHVAISAVRSAEQRLFSDGSYELAVATLHGLMCASGASHRRWRLRPICPVATGLRGGYSYCVTPRAAAVGDPRRQPFCPMRITIHECEPAQSV